MAENRAQIAVVGSVNWDICMYLEHLPAPGETVGDGRISENLGGKGANQAYACHRAGAQTHLLSCIGSDATAKQVFDELSGLGMDTQSVLTVPESATGTACIFIDAQGENCIGLTPGANSRLDAQRVQGHRQLIQNTEITLLQLEIPLSSVCEAASIARIAAKRVVLNPAPAQALPADLLRNCSVLTPNRGELQTISGIATDTDSGLAKAAQAMLARGLEELVITLGREGVLWANKKGQRRFPAYRVETIDTTAAGDTFNGFLCASLLKHWDFEQAIPFACAAAALSVTKAGAVPSIPSYDEVIDFLERQGP